jgi:polar amino acid transport system substrate-binding protein
MSKAYAAREKIILGADYWCPYNCNPNDENPGYLVEVANKIYSIYGIEVEYRLLPWSEALQEAEEGKIDGVIGISGGFSRDLAITAQPQAKSIMSVFTTQDNGWVYDGISSLKGKKIGIILDYNLTDTIRQFISSNYPSNPGLFYLEDGKDAVIASIQNLIEGKVDLYIEDEIVVNYYATNHDLQNEIKNVGRVDSAPIPLYIAFSKKIDNSQRYLKMLEEGLRSLAATGDINDLKNKYNIIN